MNTVSEKSFEKALDRIRELSRTNAELLEALRHAVNWTIGYGFPEEHKPVWMPQAEEAIRKARERR